MIKKIILIFPLLLIVLAKVFNLENVFPNPSFLWVFIITFWLVLWWITEVLPFGITALVPLLYLPMTGLDTFKGVGAHFGNPVIFLFLGGMIIASALEKTKLSERLALSLIEYAGKSAHGILIGHIVATTVLSMWISNTATTLIMVPIADSVLNCMKKSEIPGAQFDRFSQALLLSIAFSATIGGIMTPVGSPPNFVFLGYLQEMFNQRIYFHQWMMKAMPVGISFLIIMYFLITKITHPFAFSLNEDFKKSTKKMLQALGPLNSDQKYTLGVFLVVAFLWIFQPIVVKIFGHELLNDAQIAVLGGILMFIFPLGKKGSLLIKEDLHKIPWNILLLFGGGLALAGCFESSGLLPYAVDWLKTLPLHSSVLIVLVFSSSLVFISEFASNVALCNVALPFILTYCKGQNLDLSTVGMLCALATSFGFALPVATPPNAIVFGTGKIQIKDMLHVGLILDVVGVLLLVLVASVV